MPIDALIARITEIAQPYFPDLSLRIVREVAENLPPEEPTFTQISQYQNALQLEVGFCSRGVLVDVTYRAGTWQETLIRLEDIDHVVFKKSAAIVDVGLHSAKYIISYVASADPARAALERYLRSLEAKLGQ